MPTCYQPTVPSKNFFIRCIPYVFGLESGAFTRISLSVCVAEIRRAKMATPKCSLLISVAEIGSTLAHSRFRTKFTIF